MTNRKEQIEEVALSWTTEHGSKGQFQVSLDCIQEIAFVAGSEWADANPDKKITDMFLEHDHKIMKEALEALSKESEEALNSEGNSMFANLVFGNIRRETREALRKLKVN